LKNKISFKMKSIYLKGAALVALLSAECGGFSLYIPNLASHVATGSTRSPRHRLLTRRDSSIQSNSLSQLHSTVADERESVEQSKTSAGFDPADEFTGVAPSKILGDKIPYSELTIGVLKETYPGENRVSIAPESAKVLVDAGFSVIVESQGKDASTQCLDIVCCNFSPTGRSPFRSVLKLESSLLSVMPPMSIQDVLSYPVNQSTPRLIFLLKFVHPMSMKYQNWPKRLLWA
jgi:hypothetical protein